MGTSIKCEMVTYIYMDDDDGRWAVFEAGRHWDRGSTSEYEILWAG